MNRGFLLAAMFGMLTVSAFAQDAGWIGVSIAEQKDRGVLVQGVDGNGPAAKAGLRQNDVITRYQGQEVAGVLQLTRLVRETPVGRTVEIQVLRDNREQTFQIMTERAPGLIRGIPTPDLNVMRDRIGRTLPQIRVNPPASSSGIQVELLTPQLREFFGVQGDDGVLVTTVDAGSAGQKAGIKAGDVVRSVDGKGISSPAEFNREMRSLGSTVTLKIVREKRERDVPVESALR